MPLLDRTLPFDELVLIRPVGSPLAATPSQAAVSPAAAGSPLASRPCAPAGSPLPADVPLPAGYRWCAHPEQRRSQWAHLMESCGFPFTAAEALGFWDAMEAADPAAFAANLFFIIDAENNLAATCSLWPGAHFDPARWRLHWVMCAPTHQGRGLAEAACRAACQAFDRNPAMNGPLYVVTQAQSWAAIRLYEKLGFVPYEGATCKASAEKSQAAWQKARTLIAERYGYGV